MHLYRPPPVCCFDSGIFIFVEGKVSLEFLPIPAIWYSTISKSGLLLLFPDIFISTDKVEVTGYGIENHRPSLLLNDDYFKFYTFEPRHGLWKILLVIK